MEVLREWVFDDDADAIPLCDLNGGPGQERCSPRSVVVLKERFAFHGFARRRKRLSVEPSRVRGRSGDVRGGDRDVRNCACGGVDSKLSRRSGGGDEC